VIQRGLDGSNLDQDVVSAAVIEHHLPDAAQMSLGARQTISKRFL
jgi:hypothetical protein